MFLPHSLTVSLHQRKHEHADSLLKYLVPLPPLLICLEPFPPSSPLHLFALPKILQYQPLELSLLYLPSQPTIHQEDSSTNLKKHLKNNSRHTLIILLLLLRYTLRHNLQYLPLLSIFRHLIRQRIPIPYHRATHLLYFLLETIFLLFLLLRIVHLLNTLQANHPTRL